MMTNQEYRKALIDIELLIDTDQNSERLKELVGKVEAYEQALMSPGVALITAERERQIAIEGWTPEHDDEHVDGELGIAALCYAMRGLRGNIAPDVTKPEKPLTWPWDDEWWKPSPDPVRNLVKAGALIAAEIDRLQRLQQKEKPSRYRVWIEQVNQTYVEVDAKDEDDASEKAYRKWRKEDGHSRVTAVVKLEPK